MPEPPLLASFDVVEQRLPHLNKLNSLQENLGWILKSANTQGFSAVVIIRMEKAVLCYLDLACFHTKGSGTDLSTPDPNGC